MISGVIDQNLPWTLIFIGIGIAVVAALLRLPTLPFAVGVYLPLSTMGAVFLGGLLRWIITRRREEKEQQRIRKQGVLFASGLVGGEGLMGVGIAFFVLVQPPEWANQLISLGVLGIILALVAVMALARPPSD